MNYKSNEIPSYCQAPDLLSVDSQQLVQNWGRSMDDLGRELARMNGDVDEVKKELKILNRSPKPVKVGEYLTEQPDGQLVYLVAYENETAKIIPFFENNTGDFKIYRLHIVETEAEYWMIKFIETNRMILGEYEKLKRSSLFDAFIDQGIRFSGRIQRSKIKELLYEYFSPRIRYEAESINISLRAGWNNKKFISEADFSPEVLRLFGDNPVAKRVFIRNDFVKSVVDDYFHKLCLIENEAERCILFLLPYLAIMTSLLVETGLSTGIVINIVASDQMNLQKLCSIFQIFNRQRLHAKSLRCREVEVEQMLRESRDETLVFDIRIERTDTFYEKNKIQRLEKKVIDLVSGEQTIENFKGMESQVIFVNDKIICHKNIYNIFWTGQKCAVDLSKELDIILGAFVGAVEKNIDVELSMIRRIASGIQNPIKAYKAIWDIVNQFWHQQGISIKDYLQIKKYTVARMPFDSILREGVFTESMKWSVFAIAVRNEIGKWTMVHKDLARTNAAILYNEKYVWIHPKALLEILTAEGISKQLDMMLLVAKEQGYLVTADRGRTIRIQIAGRQYEYYKFMKKAFNRLGCLDIEVLAKEVV